MPAVRNALGTISEVCAFLSRSAQRGDLFRKHVEESLPDSRKTKLKALCETRWVERHDSLIVFLELFPAIVSALDSLHLGAFHVDTTTKAGMLFNAVQKLQFLVTIVVLEHTSGILLPLSKMLQSKDLDIFSANTLIEEADDLNSGFKQFVTAVDSYTAINQLRLWTTLPYCAVTSVVTF